MKKLIIIATVLLTASTLNAQIIDSWEESNENFLHRVKSISAFIERFNYTKDLDGKGVDTYPSDENALQTYLYNRKMSIFSLFDHEKLKTIDASQQIIIKSFIQTVIDPQEPVMLSFYDSTWVVKTIMNVQYNGEPHQITFLLQNKSFKPFVSAWIIKSIQCKELNILEQYSGTEFWLPPNSEGTDFINLKQEFCRKETVDKLKQAKEWKGSRFVEVLSSGQLEMLHLSEITYHFWTVPGYIFTIEEQRRDHKNSGWLIDDVLEASDEDKSNYQTKLSGL